MVLGPSMTYSCAVWSSPDITLEDAQAAKYDLICRKLGLRPGMRLLDVGLRMGRHGDARGAALRRRSRRRHAVAQPGRVRHAAPSPTPACTTSRSACRTTATSTAGSTRSARSACSSTSGWRGSASTSRTSTTCSSRARRLLNHGISRPAGKHRSRFSRRGLHRPLRVPRRRAPRGRLRRVADAAIGLRGAPRREPARALRPHAAPVGPQPRGELGRRGRERRAPHAPGCGASTWPAPRSTSRTAARRSTRSSRRAPTAGAAGCPGVPTGPDARSPRQGTTSTTAIMPEVLVIEDVAVEHEFAGEVGEARPDHDVLLRFEAAPCPASRARRRLAADRDHLEVVHVDVERMLLVGGVA